MSSQFSVDLEELDNIVTRVSALATFVADHLDEIDDRIATLTGTGWEGRAAAAYADAHRQWSAGAREFVTGLRDMSDAARTMHTRYSRANDLNRRMVGGA
ncbi:WXG100 family type VII secretion target [Nocardia harenae]|uniref:WXG100 family type VII secretion target n=1 Tax=Nocardia harenae TaxID=358707 RepID=UPI000835A2BF|nr:WXG100 family type VII secretion target [Nocardia harenae]